MLDMIKAALRVRSDAFDGEILGLIAASKADLRLLGINVPEKPVRAKKWTGDPLIDRAIILYAKAHFGYLDDKDRVQYRDAYEQLKCALSLAGDYQSGSND